VVWHLHRHWWHVDRRRIYRAGFNGIFVVRLFVDICIFWCVCLSTKHVNFTIKCVCFVFITAGPLVTSRNRAVCKWTYYRPQYIKYESRPIFFPESRFWLQRCSYITLFTSYGPQTQRYNGILLYTFCANMAFLAWILDKWLCGQAQICKNRSVEVQIDLEGQGQTCPFL